MKYKKIILFTLICILVTVPIYSQDIGQEELEEMPMQQMPMGEQEVVAEVNGEEIYLQQLNMYVEQTINEINQVDPTLFNLIMNSEEGIQLQNKYKRDVLDQIIEQILVSQELEERDIQLTEEEEDELKQEIVDQELAHYRNLAMQYGMSEEDLLAQFDGIDTIEELRAAILQQITDVEFYKFLQDILEEMDVTAEEAREIYENNPEKVEGVTPGAPFEQVEEQVIEQISLQRFMNNLKEKAEITIHEDKL